MPQTQKQGLITRQTLNREEVAAIEQLAKLCDQYENLHMRISWDMLRTRPGVDVNDFLFYMDDLLAGYLCIDSWGLDDKELVGMVHPTYRRQGIFRQLFDVARAECASRGVERILLINEHSSDAGRAFLQSIGAIYDFAEHEMLLGEFKDSMAFDERLIFRPATEEDFDMLVALKAGSFGDDEDGIRHIVTQCLQDSARQYYVATLGGANLGCQEPVGVLRLDDGEEAIGIYSFGILPDYRRRGYGRQMLEEVIRLTRAKSQKTIMLDVETDNTGALALYRSCGFQIKTTYDYYRFVLR